MVNNIPPRLSRTPHIAVFWALAAIACTACQTPGADAPSTPPVDRCTRDHDALIRGDHTEKRLALIFTGGSYGEGAEIILDALSRAGIRAGFFLTGEYLSDPQRVAGVRRMLREGHYVGPHGDAHLLLCDWSERERSLVTRETFAADLQRNIAALRRLGALPAGEPVLFVPPYEWFNQAHTAWAAAVGVHLINFTPGARTQRDYIPEGEPGFASSAQIIADALAYEAKAPDGLNGFLLLMHLGARRADKLHDHLGTLIAELRARGYDFARVDELLRACPAPRDIATSPNPVGRARQ